MGFMVERVELALGSEYFSCPVSVPFYPLLHIHVYLKLTIHCTVMTITLNSLAIKNNELERARNKKVMLNLLAQEFFLILAHPVYKM